MVQKGDFVNAAECCWEYFWFQKSYLLWQKQNVQFQLDYTPEN